VLSRFFYLYVMDHPDLVLRIPFGRREKHLPIVLSAGEVLDVLATLGSLRDRVIITVLYSAGLRLGEVCRLRVENIDSARMLLHILQAKGHKDRYVPLSPIALDLLRQWWRKTRPSGLLFACANDPLRPINHSTVQRALKTRRSPCRDQQTRFATDAAALCRVPGYAESVPFPRLFLRLAGRHNQSPSRNASN
jgi:integrase